MRASPAPRHDVGLTAQPHFDGLDGLVRRGAVAGGWRQVGALPSVSLRATIKSNDEKRAAGDRRAPSEAGGNDG